MGEAPGGEHRSEARRGPRHAARRDRSKETVVLAAVGVLVVVVGVAAMAAGRGGGDGGSDGPTSTTAALAAGDGTDPTGPIVGPSGIVGWWSGSDWVSRQDGQPPADGLDLTLVGLSGAVDTAPALVVAEECAGQQATAETDLSVELPDEGPPPIAVAGVADPRPRPVELFDPASPTYLQAAAEVGAGLGLTTPPTLTQVVRSDLDGSGTFEVVVAAEHVRDPEAPSAGDWSVVFLRRVVGDGVATDVVGSSVVGAGGGGDLDRISVSSLADLNADGRLEIVLDGRSGNGQWTAVHELGDDGVPAEVLREGCDG